MEPTVPFDVTQLPELYRIDQKRIELARRRQMAVWKGERPDKWPILFSTPLSPVQSKIPNPDLKEAFYDADLMLCSQVRGACGMANSNSDGVPSIRGNFGVGTILACLGLEQEVFPDKMPWPRQHLTWEQIADLEPDDIQIQGTFERGLDFMRRAREVMGDSLAVYCMDTQGPLDLAHLVQGDDFFYALYDDPPFVHHLLELCVELGIRAHTWMKEISGEPIDRIYHGNGLYAENMGIRICEDTSAIIAPASIEEFAVPYVQRLAQHFGGAWVHYCGRNDFLTEAMCDLPEVRGINFGHIPGHEQNQRFEGDMQRCLESGTVYWGNWARLEEESGKQYLERMYRWSSQGCMIASGNAALSGEDGFTSVEEALDYWYSLN